MKRLAITAFCALAMAGAAPTAALAAKAAVYTAPFSKLAAGGYDVVAYFAQGAAVEGSDKFTTVYKGATFRFASAANLARFKADPAAYAPQYGGYCAWAVANGYTAKGDPRHWKIVGGKLYLNYNGDIQSKWVRDIPGFIRKGNANWPAVLDK